MSSTVAFELHPLSSDERTWLTAAARPGFSVASAKIRLVGQLSRDFNPDRMDPRLFVFDAATPLGLWLVAPDHPLLRAIDLTIRHIRASIIAGGDVGVVTSRSIAQATGLEEGWVGRALFALGELGHRFYDSSKAATNTPGRYCEIEIRHHNSFNEYLRYAGLKTLFAEFYEIRGRALRIGATVATEQGTSTGRSGEGAESDATTFERLRKKLENNRTAAWIGIAVVLIGGVGGLLHELTDIHAFFKPAELTARERNAVYSLIGDLRRAPIFVSVLYQRPHPFIDASWGKVRGSDAYYESMQDEVSVFDLSNRVGRHSDSLRFFESRTGTKIGKIKELDHPAGFDWQATAEVATSNQHPTLDLASTQVVSVEPTLLPASVLAHEADLNLPGAMRAALRELGVAGHLASFSKALREGDDLLVLSSENRRDPDGKLWTFATDTPVYVQERLSGKGLLLACMALTKRIDDWAEEHSIDLGRLSRKAYDADYAKVSQ